MFKHDIELIKNTDFYIDKVLNRPVRNVFTNQLQLKNIIAGLAKNTGCSGVLELPDSDNLLVSASLFSKITLNNNPFAPQTIAFFQPPTGAYISNTHKADGAGVESPSVFTNLYDLQQIETFIYNTLQLKDLDLEKVEIKYENRKFKAKITKLTGVLNVLKVYYYIGTSNHGLNKETDWNNANLGFDNLPSLFATINNIVYEDFYGKFYNSTFTNNGAGLIPYTATLSATRYVCILNNEIQLLSTASGISLATVVLTNGVATTPTDTRVLVKEYIDQKNGRVEILGDKGLYVKNGIEIDDINQGPGNLGAIKLTAENGTFTVAGNFKVTGTTTFVESTQLKVSDNIITVNKDETGSGVTKKYAGIEVERGTADNYGFLFRETEAGRESNSFVIGSYTTTGETINGTNFQVVATRQDSFINKAIPYFNSEDRRFEGVAGFKRDNGITYIDKVNITNLEANIALTNQTFRIGNSTKTSVKIGVDTTVDTNSTLQVQGPVRIDAINNTAGYRMEFDPTTKSLMFIYVGV